MALIALFATSNTVLILLIIGSRLLYGLSANKSLPGFFSNVGKRGTPYISIIFITLLAWLSLIFGGGRKKLAHLTDLGIFTVYIFVNLSVIVLRYREPETKRLFKAPVNIGRFPLLAFLGILLNIGMLYFFELKIFMYGLALLLVGLVLYFLFDTNKQEQ